MSSLFPGAIARLGVSAVFLCVSIPAAAGTVLWGSGDSDPGSIFRIDAETGSAALVGSSGLGVGMSAVAVDPQTARLYGIAGGTCSGATLVTIDQASGSATVVGEIAGMGFAPASADPGNEPKVLGSGMPSEDDCPGGATGLTFGLDGVLYVGAWNGGTPGGKLLTVDKATGGVLSNKATDVIHGSRDPSRLAALATAPDGTIWATRGDSVPGTLHTIDPESGHFTGRIVLKNATTAIFGLAFDDDGTLYGAMPQQGRLVTIVTSGTGKGRLHTIGYFGSVEKIGGLALLGVQVAATECTAEAGGCNPTGGQHVQLPAGLDVPSDAAITQKKLLVRDPRVAGGRCEQRPLVLFGEDPTMPDLIIPEYLCGSPEFVVLITESDLSFPDGSLVTSNDPGVYFDDPLPCNSPITGDPQQQDVMVWQTTDSSDLEEGHALELTFECGSSRGRTRGLSYFVVGMHIDFGLDWNSNPWAVRAAFLDLTEVKLHYLARSVVNAKQVLSSKDYAKLLVTVGVARLSFKFRLYRLASEELTLFIKLLEQANFALVDGFNHSGNLEMRAWNARFMLDEKVINIMQ